MFRSDRDQSTGCRPLNLRAVTSTAGRFDLLFDAADAITGAANEKLDGLS